MNFNIPNLYPNKISHVMTERCVQGLITTEGISQYQRMAFAFITRLFLEMTLTLVERWFE